MSRWLVATRGYLPGQLQWSVGRDNRTETIPLRVEENFYLEPSGIGGVEAFGDATVSAAALEIGPAAIDSGEALPSPALSSQGILNLCGFETGDETELFVKTASALINSTSARSGDYGLDISFSGTGHYAELRSAQMGSLDLNRTLYFRFYLKIVALPLELSTSSIIVFAIKDTSGNRKMSIALAPDGTMELYDAADSIVGTGAQLSTGSWYRIHGKCGIGASAAVGMGVDRDPGTYDFSGTADTGSANIRAVRLGVDAVPFGTDASGWQWYFDDVTLRDDVEPSVGEIVRMDADGDGNSADWSGGYSNANEIPPDNASSTMAASADQAKHLVALESASSAGIVGMVRAVKVVARGRRDTNGTNTLRLIARTGGNDYNLGSKSMTTGFTGYGSLMTLNLADAGTWEGGDLDALEVGVKHEIDTDTPTAEVTHLSAMVEQIPIQQITASSVSTTESFGTAALSVVASISSTAIDTSESFGTVSVEVVISPPSISTEEFFETALVADVRVLEPSTIDSAESHGDSALTPGAVQISPDTISSTESLGTCSLDLGLAPLGIGSTESFGTHSVDLGIVPGAVSTAESFGTSEVQPGAVSVSPSAIASGEDHGDAVLSPGAVNIAPVGIGTTETYGDTSLSVFISPVSIDSVEDLGTASLSINLLPESIGSTETFGDANVAGQAVQILPESVPTQESLGTSTLSPGAVTVSASSVSSGEALGTPLLEVLLVCQGIASGEDVPSQTVQPGAISITPTTVSSTESFGTAELEFSFDIAAQSIATAEDLGTARLDAGIAPQGVSSSETIGSTILGVGVVASSIVSTEDFGTNRIDLLVSVFAISSQESLAEPVVSAGPVSIVCESISSTETHGGTGLTVFLACFEIMSAEDFGDTGVEVGDFSVLASPASLGETFGTSALVPGPIGVTVSAIDSEAILGDLVVEPGAVDLSPSGIDPFEPGIPRLIRFAPPRSRSGRNSITKISQDRTLRADPGKTAQSSRTLRDIPLDMPQANPKSISTGRSGNLGNANRSLPSIRQVPRPNRPRRNLGP